jgi:hypothetical protein
MEEIQYQCECRCTLVPERERGRYRVPPVKQPDTTWHDVFCRSLAQLPIVRDAARLAGVNRTLPYDHGKRYPVFAQRFADAIEDGMDVAEVSLYERALEGNVRAQIFWLRAHRPELYGDRLVVAADPRDYSKLSTVELEEIAIR